MSYDSSFEDDAQFYITTIEDSHSGSEVKFGRRPNGFNSVLFAFVGEQDFFSVQHAYSSSASKEEEQGEIIRIAYSGDNCPQKKSILFNPTKGILVKDNRTIVLDDLHLGLLYRELQKAISFASTITVDHFE